MHTVWLALRTSPLKSKDPYKGSPFWGIWLFKKVQLSELPRQGDWVAKYEIGYDIPEDNEIFDHVEVTRVMHFARPAHTVVLAVPFSEILGHTDEERRQFNLLTRSEYDELVKTGNA